MSLPLLAYAPNSQNHQVNGHKVPGDESPRLRGIETISSRNELDILIKVAYRQVFHEQQMLKSNRQILLESQLRHSLITVQG